MDQPFRFCFSRSGLALFLLVMLPNFFWFAVPAANDALRAESGTPGLDAAAGVCQVLLVAALVFLKHAGAEPFPRQRALLWGAGASLAGYYAAWACYYLGFAGPAVILALALLPCLAFGLFALDRKNWAALAAAVAFAFCHVTGSILNFLA